MKEHVFGSVDIRAEMAASMGMDPRPYLSEEQIQKQLEITGMTREEWDSEWERKLAEREKNDKEHPF